MNSTEREQALQSVLSRRKDPDPAWARGESRTRLTWGLVTATLAGLLCWLTALHQVDGDVVQTSKLLGWGALAVILTITTGVLSVVYTLRLLLPRQ